MYVKKIKQNKYMIFSKVDKKTYYFVNFYDLRKFLRIKDCKFNNDILKDIIDKGELTITDKWNINAFNIRNLFYFAKKEVLE